MNRRSVFFLVVALIVIVVTDISPCTLWSANGKDYVLGEGTLIVKNRDWFPNQIQILRLVRNKGEYVYFALIAKDENEKNGTVKAGVNEKGLVAVSATAGSISKSIRKSEYYTKDLLAKILSSCESVDQALNKKDLFYGPRFIMIADKSKIANIEIGLNGDITIRVEANGFLYHTNHYIYDEMLKYNIKIGSSSLTRLNRIQELIEKRSKPFSINDFISMSEDKKDGPDNSIYRDGSSENKNKTVAVWLVYLSKTNEDKLYVKIRDRRDNIEVYNFKLNELFSKSNFDIQFK